jgi:hypothetical protein
MTEKLKKLKGLLDQASPLADEIVQSAGTDTWVARYMPQARKAIALARESAALVLEMLEALDESYSKEASDE